MEWDYQEMASESLGNVQFHLLWVLYKMNSTLFIFCASCGILPQVKNENCQKIHNNNILHLL